MPPVDLAAARRDFDERGYAIVRGAFTPARVASLRAAIARYVDRGLAGEVEIPWIDRAQRQPARLSNLLHPAAFDPAYAEWIDADLAEIVEVLIGGPARHSLFGTLISGAGQPYIQGWHRDLVDGPAPGIEPAMRWMHERALQFNAPLLPGDRFLQVVPGSHRRAATPEEIAAHRADSTGPLPGQATVELEPGDIVYYDFNLWHRGYNPEGRPRLSMHTAFWRADVPLMNQEAGQAEAMRTPGHLDRMTPRTRGLVERYLARYDDAPPVAAKDLAPTA